MNNMETETPAPTTTTPGGGTAELGTSNGNESNNAAGAEGGTIAVAGAGGEDKTRFLFPILLLKNGHGEGEGEGGEGVVDETDPEYLEAKEAEREMLKKFELMLVDTSDEGMAQKRLLIDGDGAGDDKKLNTLAKLYVQFIEDEEMTSTYDFYREIIKQTNGLKSAVKRTFDACINSYKSVNYWEQMNTRIRKEIKELKAITAAHTQKVAEIKVRQQQDFETKAVMRTLEDGLDRETLIKEVERRDEELNVLKIREMELEESVKQRKVALDYLCSLVKRLNGADYETVDGAISEIDEKQVLSDVSMDLE